jgi:mevalonate pyrophosphate decarboxylase
MSLKEATKESLYLHDVLKELFTNNTAVKDYTAILNSKQDTIKTDSLSAIELAKNPVYYARSKHVDITYHFIRENLLSNNIDLVYENTCTILANDLTKATSIPKFKDFTSGINVVEL